MGDLRVHLLGPFRVERGEETLTAFRSMKARALLAYLVMHASQPIFRTRLAGLLWGEQEEVKARVNLRQTLSNLRRALDSSSVSPCLIVTRHTVQFDPAGECWLDVREFHGQVTDILAQNKPVLTTEDVERLSRAVDLYRGDFLEGFHVSDAPDFEEWMLGEQERLRQLALHVLYLLTAHYAGSGEYAAGIDAVTRLLALDPWREEAHRQLMLLLARSGQRRAALAQYAVCRQVLAEDLGVEPAPETVALAERIRAAPSRRHNLPPQPTSFVGREEELTAIGRLLANPECRLLTLVGPGGIGKTRLALQVAAEHVHAFLDGVVFVPLAALDAAELLAPTIADALECALHGREDPKIQLLNHLREREMLLVLDDFEHLIARSPSQEKNDATALLVDILRRAPDVKLLVTSRERLNLQWEWLFEIDGLPYPKEGLDFEDAGQSPISQSPISNSIQYPISQYPTPQYPIPNIPSPTSTWPAVQLFQQRAQQVNRRFLLTQEIAWMVRICRLVEGMPLGIELAAAWAGERSCREIARAIEQNLDFLATSLRDMPPRHRSVRAAFDHSWKLMSEEEQRVFRKLAVFRGGFRPDAAFRVAGASRRTLSALMNKSLLRRTSSDRYELHALLRQYAAEKLRAAAAEAETVRALHARHYAAFLYRRRAHLQGERQSQALAEIHAELDNVRLAWDWAIAQKEPELVEQCLESLHGFYNRSSRFQEGERAFARAAAEFSPAAAHEPRIELLVAKLLARQGVCCWQMGLFERAKRLLRRGLAMARRLNACDEMAFVLVNLGIVADRMGQYARARRLYQASLTIGAEIGRRGLTAQALFNLGEVAIKQSAYDEAERLLQESLDIHRELGLPSGIALCLNDLGGMYCALGNYSEARSLLQESLAIRRQLGDRKGMAYSLQFLGHVTEALGAYSAAGQHYRESLALFREIGDAASESGTLAGMARLYHYLNDDETAYAHGRRALRITEELGDYHLQGYVLTSLGHALAGLGRLHEAAHAYQRAETLRRDLGQHNLAIESLAGLARVILLQGDSSQALACVEAILEYLEDHTLDGVFEPCLVYLICYRVLQANDDPRAQLVLAAAHALLQERAAKIHNQTQRDSYLKNVPFHREIIEEWRVGRDS